MNYSPITLSVLLYRWEMRLQFYKSAHKIKVLNNDDKYNDNDGYDTTRMNNTHIYQCCLIKNDFLSQHSIITVTIMIFNKFCDNHFPCTLPWLFPLHYKS